PSGCRACRAQRRAAARFVCCVGRRVRVNASKGDGAAVAPLRYVLAAPASIMGPCQQQHGLLGFRAARRAPPVACPACQPGCGRRVAITHCRSMLVIYECHSLLVSFASSSFVGSPRRSFSYRIFFGP
ncbi:unnamed protein product, partial [Amoebophrya sp. A120]